MAKNNEYQRRLDIICEECSNNNTCAFTAVNEKCESYSWIEEAAEKANKWDTLDLTIEEIKLEAVERILEILNNCEEFTRDNVISLIEKEFNIKG